MSPERLKIINYVNAASELAEELTRNIKRKNRQITDETVTSLARFYKAAQDIQDLLNVIEADTKQIQ